MNLEEALSELDAKGSGYDIAVFLIGEGIKGELNEPYYCPLAVWLSKVTGERINVGLTLAVYANSYNSYDLPDNVMSFRIQFDQGHWPALVSE